MHPLRIQTTVRECDITQWTQEENPHRAPHHPVTGRFRQTLSELKARSKKPCRCENAHEPVLQRFSLLPTPRTLTIKPHRRWMSGMRLSYNTLSWMEYMAWCGKPLMNETSLIEHLSSRCGQEPDHKRRQPTLTSTPKQLNQRNLNLRKSYQSQSQLNLRKLQICFQNTTKCKNTRSAMQRTQNLQTFWKNIKKNNGLASIWKAALQTMDTNAQPVDTVMRTETGCNASGKWPNTHNWPQGVDTRVDRAKPKMLIIQIHAWRPLKKWLPIVWKAFFTCL